MYQVYLFPSLFPFQTHIEHVQPKDLICVSHFHTPHSHRHCHSIIRTTVHSSPLLLLSPPPSSNHLDIRRRNQTCKLAWTNSLPSLTIPTTRLVHPSPLLTNSSLLFRIRQTDTPTGKRLTNASLHSPLSTHPSTASAGRNNSHHPLPSPPTSLYNLTHTDPSHTQTPQARDHRSI